MLYYFSDQRRIQNTFHKISLKTKFLVEIDCDQLELRMNFQSYLEFVASI